jgi:hypothetical protein
MDQGALIEDIKDKAAMLRAAMQSGKAAAIEAAGEALRAAVDQAKTRHSWRAEPALRTVLAHLRAELDETRAFACLLADMTGQMHDLVVSRARDVRQPVYSRQGARTA